MKKVLLSFLVFGFLATGLQAQQSPDLKIRSAKADKFAGLDEQSVRTNATPSVIEMPEVAIPNDVNIVTQIAIGRAANAYGFFVDGRTASVWVDNRLNTVSFTHRQEIPSGNNLGYDISTDGGLNWENNINMYDATATGASPARYPMGGFINPEGNTDPANAVQTFVAPTLDGSQGTAGSWGGLAVGSIPFGNPAQQWQDNWATSGSQRWFLPDAFHITQQGTVFFIDELTEWDGSASTYLGSITIVKGVYDESIGEMEYTLQSIDVPVNSEDGINDIEIAFAPDGQTGYISILTNLEETLPYTSYHPVLFKTTDGGETWTPDPIEVQLGGAAGLTAIQEHLPDEYLEAYFDPEPVPPRDEIAYYIGYNQDLLVDAWGNPHIAGTVMLADLEEGTIATGGGFIASFHIWSPDGGETWDSFKLATLNQFSAEIGDVVQYNRPQISASWDGSIVFFSWLDSDIEDAEDNSRPDIYFREFLPYMGENGSHGEEVINVTQFSAAMWTANWATMPYYVFTEDMGDNTVKCTIPWVYQKLDNLNPDIPVQFYYIPDFVKTYAITGTPEISSEAVASVSQNYPNPFSKETQITISLVKASEVKLAVFNITGQLVLSEDMGYRNAGSFTAKISADELPTGVYFYTVEAGSQKVTHKMIVQ
jgi:hypothetical protein